MDKIFTKKLLKIHVSIQSHQSVYCGIFCTRQGFNTTASNVEIKLVF